MNDEKKFLQSRAAAYRRQLEDEKQLAKEPTPRESELMTAYGLEHKVAKEIDPTVAEVRGLAGAILADGVELLSEFEKRNVEEMPDEELNDIYRMLTETLGEMEHLSGQLSSEEIGKISLTSTDNLELQLNRWMRESEVKKATAVRTESFKKPENDDAAYDSLLLVVSETPLHEQYLENPWSDSPDLYHHIQREVYAHLVKFRDKILNIAFQRSIASLKGMPIDDNFLESIKEKYGSKNNVTIGEASLTIYPQIKGALQIYQKAIELMNANEIDVSEEAFPSLFPVLLGVDDMQEDYIGARYARTKIVPLGRQWLEAGENNLKYLDVVRGVVKLYNEKSMQDKIRRSRQSTSEKPATWENSWVSPQTAREITEKDMTTFLEKEIDGFGNLKPPYKQALANIFSAVARQQAQDGIWQWTNSQPDDFDYSTLPDIGNCLSFLTTPDGLKNNLHFKLLYEEIKGLYEKSFRSMIKPSKLALLGIGKSKFDYSLTHKLISKHRPSSTYGKTCEEIFGNNTISAMIKQFEYHRQSEDSIK